MSTSIIAFPIQILTEVSKINLSPQDLSME
jgi:hypothetical protein